MSQFHINLTRVDIRELKVSPLLASSRSNTYLTLPYSTIQDTSGSPNQLILHQRASTFITDTVKAEIETFTLDMNEGIMVITFNDVIRANTFDPIRATFQSRVFAVFGESYTLTSGTNSSLTDGYTLSVYLSESDLNNIKAIPALASVINNTYITLQANVINDVFGKDLTALTDGNGLRAKSYTPDITRPRLLDFDLNLNTGLLALYFSESMDISTFNPGEIILLASINNSQHYLRINSDSMHTLGSTTSVLLDLSDTDSNFLKLNLELASAANSTYLSISNNTIRDFANNLVVEINATSPLQVRLHLRDDVPPVLRLFDMDLNTGTILHAFAIRY